MKKEKIDLYYQKWHSMGKVVYSVLIDDYKHEADNFDYYGSYSSLIKDYPKTKYNYIKEETSEATYYYEALIYNDKSFRKDYVQAKNFTNALTKIKKILNEAYGKNNYEIFEISKD